MNRKRREQKLQNIAKIYIHSLNLSFNNPNLSNLSSFQSAVELAYASLNAPLQRIINNDFFYQDYPGWWKFLYKKNNYLRLRHTAVNKFLEAFYEI